MLDAFAAAGATRFNALDRMPPGIADRASQPGDERFATLTGRRATLEHVLATAAEEQPGLTVRRGAAAFELLTRPGRAAPHVVGVRTDDRRGARRRPRGRRDGPRLAHAPARDRGRRGAGRGGGRGLRLHLLHALLPRRGGARAARPAADAATGAFSILTAPGDAGTWSITVYVGSGDRPLKRLRHEAAWTALVRACPLQAHWLDGEPISGVLAMAGVLDRRRGATPTVTGVAAVGDAWACTNPSTGRGIALGLAHVALLRDTVRAHLGDPDAFAAAWRETTARELEPWYRATVATDRVRLAQMTADREGRAPDPPAERIGRARRGDAGRDGPRRRGVPRGAGDLQRASRTRGRSSPAPASPSACSPSRRSRADRRLPGPSREDVLALVA